jgi:DUF1680 family protein
MRVDYQVAPALERCDGVRYALGGEIGRRLEAVTTQWLLPAPLANPAMLEIFRERDSRPMRDLVPWAGEFAGKYLTHATQILALTRDTALEARLRAFVQQFIALQDEDGYLGPWPKAYRLGLNGPIPHVGWAWDTWGHYHALYGLLRWHALTGDDDALTCARRIGDCLCDAFLGSGRQFHEVESCEMNMAPYHGLLLLARATGEARYQALAEAIEADFAAPNAGDYVRTALDGHEFFATPKPRWESLHAIQGIAERYFMTGEEPYRRAFTHLWWSMLRGDRHNNGGFTSGEQATGNPYDWDAIETCCTVAWSAMSVDMLRMTGSSLVADELELALFNSGLGMMSPCGRWVTYDTPMDGRRVASAHSIVFQARPGQPELNCCSVNGPRMLGMIGDWALMRAADAIVLNYYGPGTFHCALPSGNACTLEQITDYPRHPDVEIRLHPAAAETFTLSLRVPRWSEQTRMAVNGEAVDGVTAGSYLRLTRCWQSGDVIRLSFDFRPHYWAQGPAYATADWETTWRVVGPAPGAADADLAQLTALPDAMTIGGQAFPAATLHSAGGVLDFGLLPGGQGSERDWVYAFTEIDSPAAATVPLRFCANYHTRILVNGSCIFDHPASGFDGDVTLRRHQVTLPLRAGRNLVALAVRRFPGHRYWLASLGIGTPVSPGEDGFQLASIYRGPVLLAFDHRYNRMDAEHIPGVDARDLQPVVEETSLPYPPWLLLNVRDVDGNLLRLCDFASAGMTGNPYRSWLPVRGVAPVEFTPENPLRSGRPAKRISCIPDK